MKKFDLGIVILAVISISFLAWGWRTEGMARVRAEMETQGLRDSIIVTKRLYNDALDTLSSRKRDFEQDTVRLRGQLNNAVISMRQLRSTADSLSVVASDTSLEPVERIAVLEQVAEARLQEAVACRVALDTLSGLFSGCTGLLARTEALLGQGQELQAAQDRLIANLTKRANPSLFVKIGKGLPYLAAGIVLGIVVAQ